MVRLVQHDVDEARHADGALVEQQLADLAKARQATTVVRDKYRHARALASVEHRLAFGMVARHRLFHVDRLSRGDHHQCVRLVRGRRRGDVDRVDVRVGDQGGGIVIPLRYTVTLRIVARLVAIAAHHGHQAATLDAVEGGTAFDLGDVTAADDAPADGCRIHIVMAPQVAGRKRRRRSWPTARVSSTLSFQRAAMSANDGKASKGLAVSPSSSGAM
jgi:hypothetical protein